MKKYKLAISNKEDWMQKCEGQIDAEQFEVFYLNLTKQKGKKLQEFDAVLPLYERDLYYLHKTGMANGERFLIPSAEVVNICEDKGKFDRFMVEHKFGKYVPQISPELRPPYILKKKQDEFGLNSFIIRTAKDERDHYAHISSQHFIKQEYFAGKEEYTAHFIFSGRKLQYLYILKFEFKEEYYVKGVQCPPFGNAVITPQPNQFEDMFIQILEALNYEGVGCFNYKISDGVPKIFELNPRVGGSLPLDVNRFLATYISTLCLAPRIETMPGFSWKKIFG